MSSIILDDDTRVHKGYGIYNDGLVERINDTSFLVKDIYVVEDICDELYTCTCPDFERRADRIEYCKHIYACLFHILSEENDHGV